MVKYDIIFVDFPHRQHDGKSSKHPALVLDGNKIANLCAQISSKVNKANKYSDNIDYVLQDWKEAGLMFPSMVRLGQQEAFTSNNVIKIIGHLSKKDIENIDKILYSKLGEDWLAPKNLSDEEYMKLIKERRPGYSFDRINKGKNRSQVLFRTLDRILKQDEERKAKKLAREKASELTHKPMINDPKYNFEDNEMPDFYKAESCDKNKMRFKKLNESYVDGDSVYLEYPSLHVEFDYVPDKYIGKHSLEEPDYVLYSETYKDDVEYEYGIDKNSVEEVIYDFLCDDAINSNAPQKDYIIDIINKYSTTNKTVEESNYYLQLINDYLDNNLDELVEIFNTELLDHFEEDAAEKAADEIRKDL